MSGPNRIDAVFALARASGRKALVVYATSGDPQPGLSAAIFQAAINGGADVVEIGVPFSDPTADGPVIQAASQRAIAHGGGLTTALSDMRTLRAANPTSAAILFGYANPFLQVGDAAAAIAAAGADGVLCVDLPPEEDDRLGPGLKTRGLHSIRLVAPTSTGKRISAAGESGGGFLYVVSVTGVTGGAAGLPADLARLIARVRKLSHLPLVIGFGIATPDDARRMAEHADGIVVGSAVVRLVAEHGKAAPAHVERFVASIREGVR